MVYIFLHNHFDNTFSFYVQTIEVEDGQKEEEAENEHEDNQTSDEIDKEENRR